MEAMNTVESYPSIRGTALLLNAIDNWAERRYPETRGLIDEDNILPLNGSREGLFYAGFIAKARRPDIPKPVILMPNPFYQVYGAAALAAGAEPVFLNAVKENSFLPDLGSLTPELLQRTIAFYICSPSNPEGAVASKDYLNKALTLARDHDFMLFSDECYSEIYNEQPPASALQASLAANNNLDNLCVFNSLSKRSNVPGLRSGIAIGDTAFMREFAAFRNVAAPQIPGPIQHVSSFLWQDEQHVVENRLQYQKKFDLAEKSLQGRYQAQKPAGGFFLWLNFSEFGGGINAVTTLWKDCGVKLLPGSYLAQNTQQGNPGENYARMALVGTIEQTEEALARIVQRLG